MATLSTKTINQYVVTPEEGERYWYLSIEPVLGYIVHVDYVSVTNTSVYYPLFGSNIRDILLNPSAELAGRPPAKNAINIWKSAKKYSIEDQFNFSEQEVLGISQIHNPQNLVVDYGALPGIRLFYLWLLGIDLQWVIDTFSILLSKNKITMVEVIEELDHMVNGTIYPFVSIITEQQKEEILTALS